MSKIPALIEQEMRGLLGRLSELVGPDYKVAFVAKNTKRTNADILLGDLPLTAQIADRMNVLLELES